MKKKIALLLPFLFSLLLIIAPTNLYAQDDPYGLTAASDINVGQAVDLKTVIANVINIALGFLGIIAVIIILFAGFKWMTAAGNEEQVSSAKKMIVQAVIGLAIIFLAWAIVSFVVTNLQIQTSAPA